MEESRGSSDSEQLMDDIRSAGSQEQSIISLQSFENRSQLLEALQVKSYPRSVEEMLIYFKHYQQEIQQICKHNDCEVVLGTEKFNIYASSQLKIDECYRNLNEQLLRHIRFIRIELKYPREKYFYINSPSKVKIVQDNQCHYTPYKEKVLYLDSKVKTQSELEEIKKKLNIAATYRVVYHSYKQRQPLYRELAVYIRKLLEHNSDMFKTAKVEVELSLENQAVHITSNENSTRGAAKNTVKKLIQQTIIMQFRLKHKMQLAVLHKYMTDIVKYPWVVAEVETNVILVVTKDSLFDKLILKSKFQELLGIGKGTVVGITLLTKSECDIGTKIQMVRGVCNDEGYRLAVENDTSCFFTPNVIRGGDSQKHYSEFLSKLIQMIMKNNDVFEFDLKSHRQHEQQRIQQSKPLPITNFYQLGESLPFSQTEALRQRFGCDLKVMKVLLNAEHLRKYNLMDGEEEKELLFNFLEWCPADRTYVVTVEFQKMHGQFFYGKRKRNNNGQLMYLPELLVKVIEG